MKDFGFAIAVETKLVQSQNAINDNKVYDLQVAPIAIGGSAALMVDMIIWI